MPPHRWIAVVLLCAFTVIGAPTAGAHTVLTDTEPAVDSTLTVAPDRVTATFNEEIQPTFAAMTVVGPDGNLWSSGETRVEGRRVSVGVRPPGPAGRYTANYRVTSADGHVVSGSWSFSLSVPGTGQPGPAAGAGPGASEPGRSSVPFVLAGVAISAGLAVWLLRRRQR